MQGLFFGAGVTLLEGSWVYGDPATPSTISLSTVAPLFEVGYKKLLTEPAGLIIEPKIFGMYIGGSYDGSWIVAAIGVGKRF